MAKDLRSFLDAINTIYPQGILTFKENQGQLDPNECECTALLKQLAKMDKWPTLIFENVTTPSGDRWPGKIILSELSNWSNAAVMVDLDPNQATTPEVLEALHQRGTHPIPWTMVKKEDAPVKNIIWTDEQADHMRLPSYRKDSDDARIGWFSGIGVAKDLETGRYNCSWHRLQLYDSKKCTARVNPRHLQELMNRYKEAGHAEIPIIWVYGHHPAFLAAAGVQVGWDIDEYEFAGAIMGESLRLTDSETWGDELLVPADAEVVVEGYLHLAEKDLNGPWSDFIYYYSPQTLEPVFRPTTITMRTDPIFSENHIGWDLITHIPAMTQMQLSLRQRFARVRAVNRISPYTFVIQFKPNMPGEAGRLAAYALGSFGDRIKNVIIVDEDIDPFDPSMVFFSIDTRVDANSDRVQIYKNLLCNRQDPSSESNFTVGGLIIDSTKPVDKPFPEIGAPPDEVMKRIKINDFLSKEEINSIPSGKK